MGVERDLILIDQLPWIAKDIWWNWELYRLLLIKQDIFLGLVTLNIIILKVLVSGILIFKVLEKDLEHYRIYYH